MSRCRSASLMAVAALTATLVTSCDSGLSLSGNSGGDTPCGDFRVMTPDDQRDVILSYLEEKGNSNPAGYEVMLTLESSKLFCNTLGTADDPIRKIETG